MAVYIDERGGRITGRIRDGITSKRLQQTAGKQLQRTVSEYLQQVNRVQIGADWALVKQIY